MNTIPCPNPDCDEGRVPLFITTVQGRSDGEPVSIDEPCDDCHGDGFLLEARCRECNLITEAEHLSEIGEDVYLCDDCTPVVNPIVAPFVPGMGR